MEIYPVHITNFKVDGGVMFGVVPKSIWENKYPADEQNLCNWALRSMIIKTDDRLVLIDTGYGDKQDEAFFEHAMLNGGDGLSGGFQKLGFSFGDITDVVLTHLHADHCGGTVRISEDGEYEPVFKNARVWVSESHWNWAMHPTIREKDAFLKENIQPIQELGLLNLVKQEGEIIPNIRVRFVNGHTKGQMVPIINYNGREVVFAADLIPSAAHIHPLFNMAYDLWQLDTIEEKQNVLNEAHEKNSILFFEHDVYNECCTLKKNHKGIRVDETMKWDDLR